MNFTQTTNEYYSKWLGTTPEIMNLNGVKFIESDERDRKQIGYPAKYDIYAYITQNQIIFSYSQSISEQINNLKCKIHCGMDACKIADIIKGEFSSCISWSLKFCYNKEPCDIDISKVVKLNKKHYMQYDDFFKKQHKDANTEGWLEEYFNDICMKGFVYGIFDKNKLISVTDAPIMPYMQDKLQEIGINTLAEYRRNGYAEQVTLACIKSIIQNGKCPLWSCDIDNIASMKLAYRVGFRKAADVLTVSL